jgi:hypothetical protein
MKLQGKEFDRSCSLFKTHQLLQCVAGNDIWLTQFKVIHHDHLKFIRTLLKFLCLLGICCVISGTNPAYIAGVFSSYFAVTCVVKTNSIFLDCLFTRSRKFKIGPFTFQPNEEKHNDDDHTYYKITYVYFPHYYRYSKSM